MVRVLSASWACFERASCYLFGHIFLPSCNRESVQVWVYRPPCFLAGALLQGIKGK